MLKAGELLWPAPPPRSMATPTTTTKATAATKAEPPNPFNETLKDTFLYSTGNFLILLFTQRTKFQYVLTINFTNINAKV